MIKSVALSTIPIALLLLWLDLRFSVIVVDSNGQPIEVQSSAVALHRPNYHYFQNYITHEGHRLATGRIYFGLLTWLQCKDDWTFPGSFEDKNGRYLGNLKWKRARWWEWPKVVVVPAD